MDITSFLLSIVKIAAVIAYLYGLLWVLGVKTKKVTIGGRGFDFSLLVNAAGAVAAWALVEFSLKGIGGVSILNKFDEGLLYQAITMTMVALGLNLIYGFNGQFSLGQWGFYGIGAYVSADITYRWTHGDSRGLVVVLLGVLISGLFILLIGKFLSNLRRKPVLSSFVTYLFGIVAAVLVAVYAGKFLAPFIDPLLGSGKNPGVLASGLWMQLVFFLAVMLGGLFAAEVSFLFGLPVFSLGSDYFGIATLGFSIVIFTLMVNSDTILPFPEMKGGRGMSGIPKLTTWFWAFFFLVLVIVAMRNIIRSSTGRAIMSVRDDETAARAMGIDVPNTKLLTFVVGSLFAGLGGGVYAHYIGYLNPNGFNFMAGFNPLIIVVFGGLGSMTGTIAASFGWMFFLEGMLRELLSKIGPEAPTWRFILYPITLLLLMLVRPQGLLGNVEWGFLKTRFISLRNNEKKEGVKPA